MLWLIWLLFALMFFVLAAFHLWESSRSITPFTLKPRLGEDIGNIKILDSDLDQPTRDFVHDVNVFVKDYNKSNRRLNRIQTLGYFLAGLTALFSLYLELLSVNSHP